MRDFLLRFTSRKFLLTVAGCIVLYVDHNYQAMVPLILAYLGVEGGADVMSRYAEEKTNQAKLQKEQTQIEISGGLDDIDTTTVVPGQSPDIAL